MLKPKDGEPGRLKEGGAVAVRDRWEVPAGDSSTGE